MFLLTPFTGIYISTNMGEQIALAQAIFKLIRSQHHAWWRHQLNEEIPNGNPPDWKEDQDIINSLNLIASSALGGWHQDWRKALRWARRKIPGIHQEVLDRVFSSIREKLATGIPHRISHPTTHSPLPSSSLPRPSFNSSSSPSLELLPNPNLLNGIRDNKIILPPGSTDPDSSSVQVELNTGELRGYALGRVYEHPPTKSRRDIRNLTPDRPIVIGDANIKFLPGISDPQIQIDILPDTKFVEITLILRKGTPVSPYVRKVILSFGFDDRAQNRTALLHKEIQAMLHAAKASFPNAIIFIPVVNFSPNLPIRIRRNIMALNHLIKGTPHPIPRLPQHLFQTDTDNTRWTSSTASSMWQHWMAFLNIQPIHPTPIQEHNHITNLSSRILSRAEINLLSKGLTFVPTWGIPKGTRLELAFDVSQYHRRLKLIAHFGPNPSSLETQLPFQPPSQWEPNWEDLPPELKILIREDIHDTSNLILEPEKPNLTHEEETALQKLSKDTSVVIKPADKGGRVVLMDRVDYIQEGYRQLNDTNYYQKLTTPIYHMTGELIHPILYTLKTSRFINHKQLQYLKGDPLPRPRKFYLLPKIHKPPDSWPIPYKVPSGRPIVSDCGSESYQTAEFIDYFLNPLSTRHQSYLKDTNHFIEKVKNLKLEEPCFLFSMDVESLYTNIDTSIGMKTVEQYFRKYPDPNRPDNQLLQLLHINLTRNDFQFNGEYFLQTRGTAMGKKFAPAYANIYMAHWEETVFPKCPLLPTQFLRFLDDIWGIWQHTQEEFEIFLGILNSHHPTIKLKAILHSESVDFLDTTTFKGPQFLETGRLDLRVYVKPTDTHTLLHRDSFHPSHTFKGILKSQILRFKRICTRIPDFRRAERNLFLALRRRGYSWSLMRSIRNNTLGVDRRLGRTGNPLDKPPIPIVTTYSTYAKQATRKLKENFNHFLSSSTSFQPYRLISAFRKNPNLRDILVTATLPSTDTCGRLPKQRCIIRTATAGRVFRIPRRFPHNISNCVYLLRCNCCQILYVGETRNSLKTRLTAHRQAIRNYPSRQTHVTAHFQRHGLINFHAMVLEHDPSWTIGQRRRREQCWIQRLGTVFPKGLNQKEISNRSEG